MADGVDRRGFLQSSAVGAGLAMAGSATAAAGGKGEGVLRHQVYFWLRRPGNAEDRAKLIAGLKKLAAVPVVKALHVGVPANTEARDVVDNSFDVSEHMVFANEADQKIYQDHPLHKAFVDENSGLWTRVVVRDSVDV